MSQLATNCPRCKVVPYGIHDRDCEFIRKSGLICTSFVRHVPWARCVVNEDGLKVVEEYWPNAKSLID